MHLLKLKLMNFLVVTGHQIVREDAAMAGNMLLLNNPNEKEEIPFLCFSSSTHGRCSFGRDDCR